jgi:diguanylate cyclase (GGDEF)-like protein
LRVGISIGVAIFPDDGADATTLLNNADAALYRAKTAGRGTTRFFEVEMDNRLRERRAIHC